MTMFNSLVMVLIISIIAFLFGLISAPLSTFFALRNNVEITKPVLNKGIDDKNPLSSIKLTGYLLILISIALILGGLIFNQVLIGIASTIFFGGIGCFTGIYLTLLKR